MHSIVQFAHQVPFILLTIAPVIDENGEHIGNQNLLNVLLFSE